MGLQELIAAQNTDDPDELTQLLFPVVLSDDELIEQIIYPALRSAVVHAMRLMTHAIERQSGLSNKPTADPTADRMAFLAEKFFVPGYGYVSWGEATIEMHQVRIDYLNNKVNGLIDTITLHDKAIQDCRQAGVKCLADIHGKRRKQKAS